MEVVSRESIVYATAALYLLIRVAFRFGTAANFLRPRERSWPGFCAV